MYLFYKIRIRSFSKAIEIDFNPFNKVDKINVYVIINMFFFNIHKNRLYFNIPTLLKKYQ